MCHAVAVSKIECSCREQLLHLRIGLERLAAYLAVLLIGTAHSEQDEDVRWDFNLSPEKAIHVFLAEYGTPSAHIFSVGSGKYTRDGMDVPNAPKNRVKPDLRVQIPYFLRKYGLHGFIKNTDPTSRQVRPRREVLC